MTFFLRNGDKTIVDIEYYTINHNDSNYLEISSAINILNYSEFYESLNKEKRKEFVYSIQALSELRGWLWERVEGNSVEQYDEVLEIVRKTVDKVAKKFNLQKVGD